MLAWLVLQGLRGSKKLKHRALSLYMCNGMRAVVEAIRSFDLVLPNGLEIMLDNCDYAYTCLDGSMAWISKDLKTLSHLINFLLYAMSQA
nr:hypothetical protein [Tanacetum cinerariifolium]